MYIYYRIILYKVKNEHVLLLILYHLLLFYSIWLKLQWITFNQWEISAFYAAPIKGDELTNVLIVVEEL